MNDYLIKFTFAFLLCAVLSGCGPRTLEDCVIEASKAPTPQGVNMGINACDDKFRKPNGNTSQAAPPVVVTDPSLKPPASQPVKPPVQTYSPPQCVGGVASWNNCIGTYTQPDGRKYDGEWREGNPNGQGTYTQPDGRKYVGEWREGKMHGQGTHSWPDGRKYVGEWKDDKRNGQGTHSWPDGVKYVGDYRDGKMHGQGTMTRADGSVIHSGLWADDKPVK